jgi:hypothetical protein
MPDPSRWTVSFNIQNRGLNEKNSLPLTSVQIVKLTCYEFSVEIIRKMLRHF